MKSFKDNEERTWDFRITMGSIDKIKARLKFDLLDLGSADFLKPLVENDRLLVQTFWLLLEDQAKQYGVDEAGFGHIFDGAAIEEASEAFSQELVNFFRGSKRETAEKLLAKTNSSVNAAYKKIGEKIDAISEKDISEAAEQQIEKETSQRNQSETT